MHSVNGSGDLFRYHNLKSIVKTVVVFFGPLCSFVFVVVEEEVKQMVNGYKDGGDLTEKLINCFERKINTKYFFSI